LTSFHTLDFNYSLSIMAADSNRSDYWKQYLADTSPCAFPIVVDGTKSEGARERVALEQAVPNLQNFCAQYGVTNEAIFTAVWAIVLKTFTGNESVCFGFLSIRDRQSRASLCSTSLGETDTLDTILRRVLRDIEKSAPHHTTRISDILSFGSQDCRDLCDTAVRFNTPGSEEQEVDEVGA
jgi:hypothetical protein